MGIGAPGILDFESNAHTLRPGVDSNWKEDRMIETGGVQPGGVLEFRISGHVTGTDYDKVLIPSIETAIEKYPKLRVLCEFDAGFEG